MPGGGKKNKQQSGASPAKAAAAQAAPAVAAAAPAPAVAAETKDVKVPVAAAPNEAHVKALCAEFKKLHVCSPTAYTQSLHAVLRDKNTTQNGFVFHSDQVMRLLVEEAANFLEYKQKTVTTPTGVKFEGLELATPLCAVSILRSGSCMEAAVKSVFRDVSIGKILIQRDESSADKTAKLIYSKLPANIKACTVLLLDPMLATGGSAITAMNVLQQAGVTAERVIFCNLVSCPDGVKALLKAHPNLRVVTGSVDLHLNEHKYIVPGIGDFGDRYFGTT